MTAHSKAKAICVLFFTTSGHDNKADRKIRFKKNVQNARIMLLPEFASWGEMSGAKSESFNQQINKKVKKAREIQNFLLLFWLLYGIILI